MPLFAVAKSRSPVRHLCSRCAVDMIDRKKGGNGPSVPGVEKGPSGSSERELRAWLSGVMDTCPEGRGPILSVAVAVLFQRIARGVVGRFLVWTDTSTPFIAVYDMPQFTKFLCVSCVQWRCPFLVFSTPVPISTSLVQRHQLEQLCCADGSLSDGSPRCDGALSMVDAEFQVLEVVPRIVRWCLVVSLK